MTSSGPITQALLDIYYPGATLLRTTTDASGTPLATFKFPPSCRATGVLNKNLLASNKPWRVAPKTDPAHPGWLCQDWRGYVDASVPYDPSDPFPIGLGLLIETETGYETKVIVLAVTDPVRLNDPTLDPDIESLKYWGMGMDDPDESNPDESIGFLSEEVRLYFGAHGVDWWHVITTIPLGGKLGNILGCKTRVINPGFSYCGNDVAVVAIESLPPSP